MRGAGLADVDRGDVIGHRPSASRLGTLRAHQCRLDLVFLAQAAKILRLHQAAGGVVIDKEFFTVEFGAAVFRDASSEFQSKAVQQPAAGHHSR
jgi:hypothetical protein